MQMIYGPGLASNIQLTAQKRLIRPAYAQTQGFPYAAVIDPSMRDVDGNLRVPENGDTAGQTTNGSYPQAAAPFPLTRTAAAYTLQSTGSIIPGIVMVKSGGGEYACVHNGNTGAAVQPMGLLGQWIAGTFDNLGQNNQVGIWMGPDSVYELVSPAWNDTTVSAAFASAGAGSPVLLYAGTDGRLTYLATPGSSVAVARVMNRPSSSRLLIQMLI